MTLVVGKKRRARDTLIQELRRELMGPSAPDEVLSGEYPSSRYIVGRLAPSRSAEGDSDAEIEPSENDTLAAGDDDSESGSEEQSLPLIVGFNPSSIGLSFLIEASTKCLRAEVSWGDYERIEGDDGPAWQRHPREAVIDGIPVDRVGPLPTIPLSPGAAPGSVTIAGVDDPEVTLEGVVHSFAGYTAVSLFLVNRRTKGEVRDRTKDERWIFQPVLRVADVGGAAIFVAKDSAEAANTALEEDEEEAADRLLYRHSREFATGHGVAANWSQDNVESPRATQVSTDPLPAFEVPQLLPATEGHSEAVLDMKTLAQASSGEGLAEAVGPLVDAYQDWADSLEAQIDEASPGGDGRDAATANVDHCRTAASRMRSGLELLRTDSVVAEAFRFANHVMWDQRIHSQWATSNQARGAVSGGAGDFDEPRRRTWRPFQLAFLLLNLPGVCKEDGPDREIVDLLWFPTGGGKTEAYLGLAAFVLALRRLVGDRDGRAAGAGVSIIMRYTLRLLTVQQFQRAAALISACEVARQQDPVTWGEEPFQIGLWVGGSTTPNTFKNSLKALDDVREGRKPRHGSPVQLVSCPRCGEALVDDRGRPVEASYLADNRTFRTRIFCPNSGTCEFSAGRGSGQGVPAVVVDEEIYRCCPSLVVATVDKFARLPFKGTTQALFGKRNRYSRRYGHLTEAHGDRVEARKILDGKEAPPLLPPELIIQDELHLISGPLGTMVGLYETAVDYMSSWQLPGGGRSRAKVIASTATIRRAKEQVHQLYGRPLAVFPPPGLSARDSFFAREVDIEPADDKTAGRLYVGVNAPGSSTKTLLVRVYSVLLAAAQAEVDANAEAADPYATLVGYFNSLRALGGAKRLVEDDIQLVRLKYLARRRGFPRRNVLSPQELTSRIDSWRIPRLLKWLEQRFPRETSNWPVDVLLATNMISVGVDIDRLGLMVVTGQPKTTAEYIQSTSRVGRQHPGLVVTMYNWLGARDLSHYERFRSYHAALYRHVEAISVTPFSSRALDRGLPGVFTGVSRLAGKRMAQETEAGSFDPLADTTQEAIDQITARGEFVEGEGAGELIRARLLQLREEWGALCSGPLRYSWLDGNRRPPNNSAVLIRTTGTTNEGAWSAPGSLREVEPTAAFFLNETEI